MNFQNQIEYGQYFDIDVLEHVAAPDPLDTDTLKSLFIIRCGLLTPLYSEPETMRDAIKTWFDVNSYGIDKMIALANTEYLPLENYRRNETGGRSYNRTRGESETGERDLVRRNGEKEQITDSGTITDESESTNEKTVSAYNESEYSPDEKNTAEGSNTRTLDTERNRDLSGTQNDDENTKRNVEETIADAENDTRLVYGNIGTMTAQTMFNEELDLLARFNPYDWIISRLENELFLSIW